MNPTDKASSRPMQEALQLWQQITGVDPNATRFRLGDWELKATFERIQEAIDLDPTEITATMLLTYFLNEYLKNREVAFDGLLRNPQPILDQLAKCRSLLEILEHPEVLEVRERFAAALSKALGQYDAADREDVKTLLSKPDELAILRRDALRSIKQLRVDQFLDGAPEPEGVKPVYTKVVHQWWNINSMLAAAPRMPSGVSLNLIRHPDAYQSYFAFMIRNGGNVFVLSDIEKHNHPLQGYMSRRPDRDLNRRVCRNWFPYDLLGVAFDEESQRLYIKESQERGLVAYQNAALPLKPVAEIGAAEVVWASMMFDLIVERFWRQGYKAPALSYTAEMLKSDTVLIESAKNSNLPVPAYQTIGLPPLTLADVAGENVSEEAVGEKHDSPNAWMEQRYSDKVVEESLNLVTAPEHVFAIEHKTGALVEIENGFRALPSWEQQNSLKGKTKLEVMNATSFGSREQIERDRLFIARANYAGQIGALAEAEYAARKDEVREWYRSRVMANMDNLLKWAGCDGVWIDDGVHEYFTSYHNGVGSMCSIAPTGDEHGSRKRIYHSVIDRHDINADSYAYIGSMYLGKWSNGTGGHALCQINGVKASYYVMYSPTNPVEIAWLANCAVEDLPDVLLHWSQFNAYTGNRILDRIDPMIWKASNPWINLDLRVRLAFSKRAMAQLEKTVVRPQLPNMIEGAPREHSAKSRQ